MLHWLWVVLIGLVIGALAKLIMPGKDPWRGYCHNPTRHRRLTRRYRSWPGGRLVRRRGIGGLHYVGDRRYRAACDLSRCEAAAGSSLIR